MEETERFLDVNVPMYAAGRAHPYKEPCAWVMTEIAEGRLEVAIDVEIVQEILHRYGAIGRREVGLTLAKNLLDLVSTVYPVEPEDVRLAMELFRRYGPRGLTARDAIHAAVMQRYGIREIISTDAHFDLIRGIRRLDPKEMYVAEGG